MDKMIELENRNLFLSISKLNQFGQPVSPFGVELNVFVRVFPASNVSGKRESRQIWLQQPAKSLNPAGFTADEDDRQPGC